MSTLDSVKEAISVLFPNFDGEVTEKTTADDVEGWDSVTHVQLMFVLEDITGKSIDLAQSVGVSSVGDLVRLIERA